MGVKEVGLRCRALLGMGAALTCAAVVTSCGGGSSGSPLDDALGYLPSDAPAAVAISTDLESGSFHDLDIALQRFGVQGGVEGALDNALGSDGGVSFTNDIEPLLGNDLVIGVLPGSEESGPRFVAATRVSDGGKAEDLFSSFGLKKQDDVDGASVYGEEFSGPANEDIAVGPEVAVDGDNVVAAGSAAALEAALDQKDSGDGLTEATFNDRLGDVPHDGLIRASGDLQSAIDALGIEQTSGVAWMGALKSFGVSLDVSGRTLNADALVSTDNVSEADLPIAAGSASPGLAPHVKSTGNVDQSQSMRFALDLVRASVPQATFNQIQSRLERAAHGSLGALEGQFGAGIGAELSSGEPVSRSEVKDPSTVARALRALSAEEPAVALAASEGGQIGDALDAAQTLIPALPVPQEGFFPRGSTVGAVPGMPDLYQLSSHIPAGSAIPTDHFFFGLIGDVFVTAPSLKAAQQAARLKLSDLKTPPGAFAFSLPLHVSDFSFFSESSDTTGAGITLTTLKGGIEASSDALRLRAVAGL